MTVIPQKLSQLIEKLCFLIVEGLISRSRKSDGGARACPGGCAAESVARPLVAEVIRPAHAAAGVGRVGAARILVSLLIDGGGAVGELRHVGHGGRRVGD